MFFDQLGDRKTAHKILKEQAPLLHEQVDIAVRALEILRAGAVIVDEVDLILHPLRRYRGRCLAGGAIFFVCLRLIVGWLQHVQAATHYVMTELLLLLVTGSLFFARGSFRSFRLVLCHRTLTAAKCRYLNSELNYPIGPKTAIDLSKKGLRWDIPLYLLDALFYATEGRTTVRITLSAESEDLLRQIKLKV